jgi:hypothetical protein
VKRTASKAKTKAKTRKRAKRGLAGKPAKPQKKRPPRKPVKQPRRAKSTKARGSTATKLHEFAPGVKRAATGGARAREHERRLSQTPSAIRARTYRANQRAIAEALEGKRQDRLERRRLRRKFLQWKAKIEAGRAKTPKLAIGWLERIRADASEIEHCSLALVRHNVGDPNLWMVVGRFDFDGPVDYQTMGTVLERLMDNYELAQDIGTQRLSQIRILYHDPRARRNEADGTISKIAGWLFCLGDLVGEIIGGGEGDEGALAERYEQTGIKTFYVYFSKIVSKAFTEVPWAAKTTTVRIR